MSMVSELLKKFGVPEINLTQATQKLAQGDVHGFFTALPAQYQLLIVHYLETQFVKAIEAHVPANLQPVIDPVIESAAVGAVADLTGGAT